jgi:hypothetical protein
MRPTTRRTTRAFVNIERQGMRAIETGYHRGHQATILCTTEYFCTIFRRESWIPAKRETDQPLATPFWPDHTAIF